MPGRFLLIAVVLLLAGHAPAVAQSEELRALKGKALSFSQPSEALAAAQRAVEIAEGLFGPDHVEVGEVLSVLARLHVFKDRFADAEPLEKRAIAIMEKGLGADHPAMADFLVRIANTHVRKRFAYAEPLYKRALDIYERAWASDPRLAHMLWGVGYMYDGLRRHGDAIPLYERALALAEKTLAANDPWRFMFLRHLPYAYLARGRYADSERATRRYMAEIGRWLGSEQQEAVHSDDLRRLAHLYFEQGYYADAEWFFKRAHRIEQTFGDPSVASTRHARELAAVYTADSRYAEAEEIYGRLLGKLEEAVAAEDQTKAELAAIRDKLRTIPLRDMTARQPFQVQLGRLIGRLPRYGEIAGILGRLGSIRWKQGKHAEAEALFERAFELLGDSNDQSVVILMAEMAGMYVDQNRFTEAEQLYVRALQLDEDDENWGRPVPRTWVDAARILNGLGRLALKRKRFERAEELHKRALKILEGLGPDRFDVGTTLNDLAELYRSQGRYADAEPLYRRALDICEKGNLSPNHGLVRSVLANLAALYEGQGRHADADRLKRGGLHAGFWVPR